MATAKKAAPKKASGGTRTIPAKGGNKAITFKQGGLHQTTGTPAGQKVPKSKVAAAARGAYGPKGKKQAALYNNVLKKGGR